MLLARRTPSTEATWYQVLVVEVMRAAQTARRKCCEIATVSRAGLHTHGKDCGVEPSARISAGGRSSSQTVPDGPLYVENDLLERKIRIDLDHASTRRVPQLPNDLDLAPEQEL